MDDSGIRLKEFLLKKGIEQKIVAEYLQVTPQYINAICQGRKNVSKKFANLLQKEYNVNAGWLLTGNGEMTNDTGEAKEYDIDVIMLPVINLDARGGFGENGESGLEYITERMPFSRNIARDGDVVIPVFGDSMEPKFPSGSYILIRLVAMWQEYLELGASYVIELIDDRRILKNIQRSDDNDKFLLESVNPKFEPMEIPKKMIRRIYQVLMSIKRETI